MEKPKFEHPVLARITKQGNLGLESWYEVVTCINKEWFSYSGSDTFSGGESVAYWIYASVALADAATEFIKK